MTIRKNGVAPCTAFRFSAGIANWPDATETGAEEIFICIPSATQSQMRGILDACRETDVPVRTLPSLGELVDEKVSPRDLRSPRIEDLLQREEIRVDERKRAEWWAEKWCWLRALAAASAPSSVGRSRSDPRKLLLLDKSENSLFTWTSK